MTSLLQLGAQGLQAFEQEVSLEFDELVNSSVPLRDELSSNEIILNYTDVDVPRLASVVTVDGGCVVQQLAGLDLVDVCAVSAEGLHGRKVFSTAESSPKYYWGGYLRDHTSSVSNLATTAMSLQEMMLLEDERVRDHHLRIIDGSWSSALLSVGMVIQRDMRGSALLNRMVLDMIHIYGEDIIDTIHSSIERRIRPWLHAVHSDDNDASVMIAVSKSDSQRAYQRYFERLGLKSVVSDGIADRNLANLVLQPGEMLPIIDSAFNRPRETQRTDDATLLAGERAMHRLPDEHIKTLKPFYERIRDVLDVRVGSIANAADVRRLHDEKWLHTTYFKPENSGEHARPIRVELIRPSNLDPDASEFQENINAYAKKNIVNALADDILPQAQEPMSQYFADRIAKEISVVSRLRREALITNTKNERFRSAIINEYRT